MASLLNGTNNTRPLLDGSLRYIRSDAVLCLSEQDIAWLAENGVTTIVDLRTAAEAQHRPCCLKGHAGFEYVNIPVSGGNVVPQSAEMVPLSYLNMVDGIMWEIISLIENAKTNVLYFCHAGKDRTGVVSALLLLRLGASHAEIIRDYMLSCDNLRELLEAHCRANPGVDIDIITPRAAYMEQFLRDVRL